MGRPRIRDLGVVIGGLPTGRHNAITDVPGVTVGHSTIIRDTPHVVRTGVTVILPRGENSAEDFTFAGYHSLNGCGEMTGLPWVEESGLLASPVALTNTSQVGTVHDAIIKYAATRVRRGYAYRLPVVAETYDGWLSDSDSFPITVDDVFAALDGAGGGAVEEGNVGGGTGMICHDFKGGGGTASRVVATGTGDYVVGAWVQANYGDRHLLRIDGVPVGREIGPQLVPLPWETPPPSSSIIVVIATDAPLLSPQCRLLAQRATIGLARAGGVGYMFSGDLFLAFSTGNHVRPAGEGLMEYRALPLFEMNPLIEATAEAVEEAIANALMAAETMTGRHGRIAYALPVDELKRVMARYRPRD